MNKKVVGVILIVLAIVLGWYAWGKIQPYFAPVPEAPAPAPGQSPI